MHARPAFTCLAPKLYRASALHKGMGYYLLMVPDVSVITGTCYESLLACQEITYDCTEIHSPPPLAAYQGSSAVRPLFAGPAKNTRLDRLKLIVGFRNRVLSGCSQGVGGTTMSRPAEGSGEVRAALGVIRVCHQSVSENQPPESRLIHRVSPECLQSDSL